MSTLSEELQGYFNDDILLETIEEDGDVNTVYFGEISLQLAIDQYKMAKNILIQSLADNSFDFIPFARRTKIVEYYRYAYTHRNAIQTALNYIDLFVDEVNASGISNRIFTITDINKQISMVVNLSNKYNKLEKIFNDNSSYIDDIKSAKIDTDKSISSLESYLSDIATSKLNAEKSFFAITSHEKQAEGILEDVRIYEKEVEARKLSIETFAINIEEYKAAINDSEQKAKNIVGQEEKINNLITQAENALGLKSAEGISAAFSSQYTKANEGKWIWLAFAGVFVVAAGLATVWILTGWGIAVKDSLATIIGRIVAVGLMVASSSFCANQYNKQKIIAEDYAYKAVLAKSILAFSEEIKIKSDGQLTEYLTKVLNEIHKDPQRSRSTKNNTFNKLNLNTLVEKLIDKIPGSSQ